MASGKIIGLDIGTRRIGIAITDETGAICFPRTVIESSEEKLLLQKTADYITNEKVLHVVVGLPLDEENELTEHAKWIENFAQHLAQVVPGIILHYVDEFGSTREAQGKIPLKRDRKVKGADDVQAALIILQRFVEQRDSAL